MRRNATFHTDAFIKIIEWARNIKRKNQVWFHNFGCIYATIDAFFYKTKENLEAKGDSFSWSVSKKNGQRLTTLYRTRVRHCLEQKNVIF